MWSNHSPKNSSFLKDFLKSEAKSGEEKHRLLPWGIRSKDKFRGSEKAAETEKPTEFVLQFFIEPKKDCGT